jgi:hypothetical protein
LKQEDAGVDVSIWEKMLKKLEKKMTNLPENTGIISCQIHGRLFVDNW